MKEQRNVRKEEVFFSYEKGITLIALVITIIVLLILAGVALKLIVGGDGILGKTEKSVNLTNEAAAKERLEMLLSEYRMEKITENKQFEEFWKEKQTEQQIDHYEKPVDQSKDWIITIDGFDFEVNEETLEIQRAEREITVSWSTNPSGWTNQNVTVTIEIESSNGIANIVPMDNATKISEQKYQIIKTNITSNAEFSYDITDSAGNTETKKVKISNIDTIKPKDFTPEIIETTTNGFKIKAEADDENETQTDGKSGMDKYVYIIGSNTYETQDTSIEISDLEAGTQYPILVRAYDKAGNYKDADLGTHETLSVGLTLYQNGNEFSDITGGWMIDMNQEYAYASKSNNCLSINSTQVEYGFGRIKTVNKIDVTNYNKLYVYAELNGPWSSDDDTNWFGLWVPGNKIAVSFLKDWSWGDLEKRGVDISSVTGSYYVTIMGCASLKVYKIWLE